jgi:hypothetical protein
MKVLCRDNNPIIKNGDLLLTMYSSIHGAHPNRNPHADMIHEWAETGRTVQVLDEFSDTWGDDAHPKWIASWKYRWADEQMKPDVKVAAWITSDSVKLYKDNREYGSRNAIFTFDADGNIKGVEKIG